MCPAAAVALAFVLSFDPVNADEADQLAATLARFPSMSTAKEYSALNDQHYDWVVLLLSCCPASKACEDWREECARCGECWRCLGKAHDPTLGIKKRQIAAKRLQIYLDDEDFLQGRMPPPVPVWRFREGPPPLGTLPIPEPKPRVIDVFVVS